ncbi:MAG: hypothetical protein OXR84_01155 [Magnetovibrio sp.]|nr:hypothetical protein [Magnetovibrio sp.]
MDIRFQPAQVSVRFELPVYGYFAIGYAVFGGIGLIGAEAVHARSMLFWIGWPTVFFTYCLILFRVAARQVVYRCVGIVLAGVIAALVKWFLVSRGIIDPIYVFLVAAICAIVIGVYRGQFLNEQLEKLDGVEVYDEATGKFLESVVGGYRYLLSRAFQGYLALAASLGVSMSILFNEGFGDPTLKFSGLKMFVGFVLMSFAGGIWLAVPLLNGMVKAQEKLLTLATGNQTDEAG